MALRQDTLVQLNECSLGIQHSVAVGQTMDGHAPAAATPPFQFEDVRKVVIYAQPADGQMGLFDPHVHAVSNINPYLTGIQIIGHAALAWDVYLTSGDASLGTPTAQTVHDPLYDMPLASSTVVGAGPAYINLNREIQPGQLIRVVCGSAVGIETRVVPMFCNTIGAGGRLVGG